MVRLPPSRKFSSLDSYKNFLFTHGPSSLCCRTADHPLREAALSFHPGSSVCLHTCSDNQHGFSLLVTISKRVVRCSPGGGGRAVNMLSTKYQLAGISPNCLGTIEHALVVSADGLGHHSDTISIIALKKTMIENREPII